MSSLVMRIVAASLATLGHLGLERLSIVLQTPCRRRVKLKITNVGDSKQLLPMREEHEIAIASDRGTKEARLVDCDFGQRSCKR
jgi:hypothetical protein